jgi:hypothetical protein
LVVKSMTNPPVDNFRDGSNPRKNPVRRRLIVTPHNSTLLITMEHPVLSVPSDFPHCFLRRAFTAANISVSSVSTLAIQGIPPKETALGTVTSMVTTSLADAPAGGVRILLNSPIAAASMVVTGLKVTGARDRRNVGEEVGAEVGDARGSVEGEDVTTCACSDVDVGVYRQDREGKVPSE